MWSPFLLLIALPLSLRSVRAQSALFLTGPATVTACIPAVFTWTNGTSPYTFHPSVGTDGVPQQEVGGILDAAFAWYAENQPAGATVQISVVDAVGVVSNILNYSILNSGACVSSSSNLTLTSSTTASMVATTATQLSSSVVTAAGPSASIPLAGTAGNATTQTMVAPGPTTRTAFPTNSPTAESAAITFRLSSSTILIIAATVGSALFLITSIFCWRWYRTRKGRKLQRRSQPRQLMMNADLNGSGLLLTTSSSRQYGPVPATPNSGTVALPAASLATNVLPSSKERRMRGAVNREADLEDGLSVSDTSGRMSTAHSTSIWPASSIASPEHSPSQDRFPEPILHNQQSLQAIIGREIQEMLDNSEPPTNFGSTASPFSSSDDPQSSRASGLVRAAALNPKPEQSNLSLEIHQIGRDPRSILQSSATPISRRDMEVLADLVAQRLISGLAVDSPARDHNPEGPPPRYS